MNFHNTKSFTNQVPLTIFFATWPMQQFDPFFFVHILSLVGSLWRLGRGLEAIQFIILIHNDVDDL